MKFHCTIEAVAPTYTTGGSMMLVRNNTTGKFEVLPVPTSANNGVLTITGEGIATGSQTFSANQSTNATATITVPGTNIGANLTGSTLNITSTTGTGASVNLSSLTPTTPSLQAVRDINKYITPAAYGIANSHITFGAQDLSAMSVYPMSSGTNSFALETTDTGGGYGGNIHLQPNGYGFAFYKGNEIATVNQLHNPVTIGTANGLSLSTQVLSLAAANTSTTGALTSTDWNTFNNKQATLSGTGVLSFAGTTPSYSAGTANQILRRNAANTAYEFFTPTWTSSTGTVTNFSAGTLSPLFTTSVATSTTTPALTFALTAAGANTWFGNAGASSASPAYNSLGALTKTDDANVTLTLGGTPATALVKSVSMTLGWSGLLSVARGGTGVGTLTGVAIGNGTSAFTGVTGTAGQLLRRNAANTAYEFFTPTYLTTETDPTVPGHVKAITTTNISNWNTAFGWGNHAGLYLRNGSNYTAANTSGLNWSGKNEGATGFPETYGSVLSFGGSGYLTQFNGQTGDNNVYFRNSGAHGWGVWQTLASKEWVISILPSTPSLQQVRDVSRYITPAGYGVSNQHIVFSAQDLSSMSIYPVGAGTNTFALETFDTGGGYGGRIVLQPAGYGDIASGGEHTFIKNIWFGSSSGRAIRGDGYISFLTSTGANAQQIATGGLLASNDYGDVSAIPTNGAFIKGSIRTNSLIGTGVRIVGAAADGTLQITSETDPVFETHALRQPLKWKGVMNSVDYNNFNAIYEAGVYTCPWGGDWDAYVINKPVGSLTGSNVRALLEVHNENQAGNFVVVQKLSLSTDGTSQIWQRALTHTGAWGNWVNLGGTTYTGSTSITLTSGSFTRAALTGDVTAAANSNSTTITNNAVTYAKMQDIATQTLIGRGASGTGDPGAVTIGSGLALSTGNVLSANQLTITPTLDFPPISGVGSTSYVDVSMTGAAVGDTVVLGLPIPIGEADLFVRGYVIGADTVRVRITAITNIIADYPPYVFTIKILK